MKKCPTTPTYYPALQSPVAKSKGEKGFGA